MISEHHHHYLDDNDDDDDDEEDDDDNDDEDDDNVRIFESRRISYGKKVSRLCRSQMLSVKLFRCADIGKFRLEGNLHYLHYLQDNISQAKNVHNIFSYILLLKLSCLSVAKK